MKPVTGKDIVITTRLAGREVAMNFGPDSIKEAEERIGIPWAEIAERMLAFDMDLIEKVPPTLIICGIRGACRAAGKEPPTDQQITAWMDMDPWGKVGILTQAAQIFTSLSQQVNQNQN